MANYGFTIKRIRENAFYLYRWTYIESKYYEILANEIGLTVAEVLDIKANNREKWKSDQFEKVRKKMKTKSNSKLQWQSLGRWYDEVPRMKDITINKNSLDEVTETEQKILKMDVVHCYLTALAEIRAKANWTLPRDEMKILLKEKNGKVKELTRHGNKIKEADALIMDEYFEKAKKYNAK